MPTRGTYNFETDNKGGLVDNNANLDKVRNLFRDSAIIKGNWGPGNDGDFDNGSWHILCHLAAGSGVLETKSGRAWCGITHRPADDSYQASLVYRRNGSTVTVPLASVEGSSLADGGQLLAYIEGSSNGHIAARGVNDPPGAFNGWPRQMFDKEVDSLVDGGTIWECWSTTRDIRSSSLIGTSVLRAYLTLVSRLGGRYIAAVARGRREHDHPIQIAALLKAGLLTCDDAIWDVSPEPIPQNVQDLLYQSREEDSLRAAEMLPLTRGIQKYFMFQRRIECWSQTDDVRRDLGM